MKRVTLMDDSADFGEFAAARMPLQDKSNTSGTPQNVKAETGGGAQELEAIHTSNINNPNVAMPAATPAPVSEGSGVPGMRSSYEYGSSVLPPVSRSIYGSPGVCICARACVRVY